MAAAAAATLASWASRARLALRCRAAIELYAARAGVVACVAVPTLHLAFCRNCSFRLRSKRRTGRNGESCEDCDGLHPRLAASCRDSAGKKPALPSGVKTLGSKRRSQEPSPIVGHAALQIRAGRLRVQKRQPTRRNSFGEGATLRKALRTATKESAPKAGAAPERATKPWPPGSRKR